MSHARPNFESNVSYYNFKAYHVKSSNVIEIKCYKTKKKEEKKCALNKFVIIFICFVSFEEFKNKILFPVCSFFFSIKIK